MPPSNISPETVAALKEYTACDVSDALLRLGVPGAGFLPDLEQCSPGGSSNTSITIAPASTVLFAPKGVGLDSSWPEKNIPPQANWSDISEPNTIAVLRQPAGQTNAVCGGIMALRMKVLGLKGIVAVGRVRDVEELRATGLPVSALPSLIGRTGEGVAVCALPPSLSILDTKYP